MITFHRSNHKVLVHIKHGIFPETSDQGFSLEIVQSYNYQAELLRQQLENNMAKKLEEIKRDAYNKGWKDAMRKGMPAKVRKQKHFYGGW